MTREEAKMWLDTLRCFDPAKDQDPFDVNVDADELLALIDKEVAAALKTERADAHWRSWDWGG